MAKDVSIAVIGSVNVDIVASVREFPLPGETVTGATVKRFGGGKGANQALAAHRLGAQVYMVACVGDDPAADEALLTLRSEGIDLSYCQSLEATPTGLAIIVVSESGENQIVVAPGANAAFSPEQLRVPQVDAIIAQLEVPVETIYKAAVSRDCFFCLNAAPAKPVPPELLDLVDLLVVNEIEAQALGNKLDNYRGLLATTYGSQGAVLSCHGEQLAKAEPQTVKAVDTTGAGDAFTAALTVSLISGKSQQEALDFACTVGALTTTRLGAQSSPTTAEIKENKLDG